MQRLARFVLLSMPVACWACSAGPSGSGAAVPPVPVERLGSPQAVERGRALFDGHCALCHGERGDGHGVRRFAMRTPPRDLTNRSWQEQIGPRELFRIIRDGVRGTQMPAWRAFDDDQIWDLVAYVRRLPGGGR